MSWFCNPPEAIEQIKICKKNNCPDCEKCIWIQESSIAMSKYGTFVEKQPKKEKLIQSKEVISKFDNMAKNVVKVSEEFDHPLYHEIIRVFKKQ